MAYINKYLSYSTEKLKRIDFKWNLMERNSLINKSIDFANFGLNRGAGLRKTFSANPLRNPLVQKEYLEDKIEGDDDRMKDDADIFFPVDVTAKYAIKALQAVFSKSKELTYDKLRDALETAGETEDRNIEKEKFEEKIK